MRNLTRGLVIAASCFIACATARVSVLDTYERNLQALLQRDGSEVVAGEAFPVTFILLNAGTATVDGCFGSAYQVAFWNGKQAQGWAETVDHPTCEEHFMLKPGAQVTRRYIATVPKISNGPATVVGWVQVVNPHQCDEYGCDAIQLRAQKSVQVIVVSKTTDSSAG